MPSRKKFTPKTRVKFLGLIAEGHTAKRAAELCAVSVTCVYDHKYADPTFAAEWEQAWELGTQTLEQEAIRRALHGVERPMVSAGKLVAYEQVYSDKMLEIMLKARRPEVYRDNVNVEVFIRKAALEAGIDPDMAVAEAQAIVKEAKAR